jgi:hypothetical protein
MDYSYDYNHSSDLSKTNAESGSKSLGVADLSKATVQSLAGAILMGLLLYLSSTLDNLFMNELIAVSIIWGLVSLVRLQAEPSKNTSNEKR